MSKGMRCTAQGAAGFIQAGLLEVSEDNRLRGDLFNAILSMDNYELTIAAAYIKRLIAARKKA